ncbi:twin-arginine translocation signal domain-containing protein [Acaryochloris sp. CCMEE 5410]|uniref:twin-arginine translocation signal domain-containing protein n=1 Tax=Acaryochloris sp. CCMEE 5410 TaxID=310037 RepID=UPI0002F7D2B2|nr:twin-arginine translocation signal domain-containing protein [Acaryochloris sp. CCMEE 5410]KAI9135162.1 twin-arginine translocation signal domain-containing protein [Acaryochloris sp. CCMEE 5410]
MAAIDRRQFLTLTGGTAALLTLGASRSEQSKAKVPALTNRIKLQAWTSTGKPMPAKVFNQTFFLTLGDEPMPNPPRQVDSGVLWTTPPPVPFAIVLYLAVKGFGKVALYADNQGRGYTPADFPLNLNLACAESRIHRVRTGPIPSISLQNTSER